MRIGEPTPAISNGGENVTNKNCFIYYPTRTISIQHDLSLPLPKMQIKNIMVMCIKQLYYYVLSFEVVRGMKKNVTNTSDDSFTLQAWKASEPRSILFFCA